MNETTLPKNVYAVTVRDNSGSVHTKIGLAYDNRDGSITVRLDALPVNGILVIGERAAVTK